MNKVTILTATRAVPEAVAVDGSLREGEIGMLAQLAMDDINRRIEALGERISSAYVVVDVRVTAFLPPR